MATALLDPKFGTSINQRFRAKRFKFFMSLLEKIKSDKPLKILDLGGYERYWERMGYLGDDNVHITLLNLEKEITKNKNFSSVAGDATNLHQFKDNEFDIVFSNSMIEHLFSRESQQKMADEARQHVDERLLYSYDRIRKNYRNGLAVVPVERDACGGCFYAIPPQKQSEIRQRKKVIVCENCGRILIDEDLNNGVEVK